MSKETYTREEVEREMLNMLSVHEYSEAINDPLEDAIRVSLEAKRQNSVGVSYPARWLKEYLKQTKFKK